MCGGERASLSRAGDTAEVEVHICHPRSLNHGRPVCRDKPERKTVIGVQQRKTPNAEMGRDPMEAETPIDSGKSGHQPCQFRRCKCLKTEQFGVPEQWASGLLTVCTRTIHDGSKPDQRWAGGLACTAFKAGVQMSIEPFVAWNLSGDPALYQGDATAWGIGLVALEAEGWTMFETKTALDALVREVEQVVLPAICRFGDC